MTLGGPVTRSGEEGRWRRAEGRPKRCTVDTLCSDTVGCPAPWISIYVLFESSTEAAPAALSRSVQPSVGTVLNWILNDLLFESAR